MRPFADLVEIAETISNRADIPAIVCDWATDLHDHLTSRSAKRTVLVEDLSLLQAFGEDEGHGLFRIDNALARRS